MVNLRTVSDPRLREMIAETEGASKPDPVALAILRRELARREVQRRTETRKAVADER